MEKYRMPHALRKWNLLGRHYEQQHAYFRRQSLAYRSDRVDEKFQARLRLDEPAGKEGKG